MDTQQFIRLCEDLNYNVRSYSGRGMFGKNCVGVTLDENPIDFIINLLSEEMEPEERDVLVEILRKYRIDNMGMGSIIYFPSLKWEEDESK
jgi:hypothetical protein